MKPNSEAYLRSALAQLEDRVGSLDSIKNRIKHHRIETPSWGYGDSGTRFKVFTQPGAARTVWEKIDDAATVHRFTGAAPSVALHIPWDKVDDYAALSAFALERGVSLGAINPNVFQDDCYKLGSLTHEDRAVRKKAVDHLIECVEIAKEVRSSLLSLWFADGTNYPGQGDIRRRKRWMQEGLAETYAAMPPGMRMLVEYKFFEPAFYHTDIADWGMSFAYCKHLGEQAQVLIDLGHHPLGTNIEHIVAFLLDEGKMGGFHFNNKKYADDDVTVGSVNPYELFLIYNELVAAEDDPEIHADVAYMIDQSHNVKPKIEAMIQSIQNCQTQYARACLVDRKALKEAQQSGDIVRAEEVLQDAYQTDVRPLLAQVRVEQGLDPDPLQAYRGSGHQAGIEASRGKRGADKVTSGYPG
ncbi:MAG: L-rhamnose isomerase [Candidatus Hydrogenedentota bacterium]